MYAFSLSLSPLFLPRARLNDPFRRTCVFCRAEWSAQPSGTAAAAGPSYSAEGYLNLADSVGISRERDTSTCALFFFSPAVEKSFRELIFFREAQITMDRRRASRGMEVMGGTGGTREGGGEDLSLGRLLLCFFLPTSCVLRSFSCCSTRSEERD